MIFFIKMVYFHSKAKITKTKILNPQLLSKYRPNCLVGNLHKILSKILAARLKSVIGNLISIKQSTFIKQRNIMDVIFMVTKFMI